VGLPAAAMCVVSTCQDVALWRDTQGKSCQDYANHPAWCQGLARVPALPTPPADPFLVLALLLVNPPCLAFTVSDSKLMPIPTSRVL
jgi:hypothetical protein